MTKKKKNELFGIIEGLGIIIGFYIWYKSDLQIMGLIAVLLVPAIMGAIIINLIPDKVQKKKKPKNKTTSKKSTTNKEKASTSPIKEHNLLRSENEILTLPLMELSWREFERLCYLYYKAKGYKVEETSEGADGGVDLIVFNRHHGTKIAIQIKHRKSGNNVSVDEIRALHGAKRNHGCSLADFITTSRYSSTALREASQLKIETKDLHWVENKILSWREKEAKKRELA